MPLPHTQPPLVTKRGEIVSPITSSCSPLSRADDAHTIEWFPEGKYGQREFTLIHPDMAEAAFDEEVKKSVAFRTKEECWEPLVIRLLDGSDLEKRRTVIK